MKLTAELTRTLAGYKVLLIDGILVADIDFGTNTNESDKLGEIIGVAQEHRLSFRIYKTFNGLRPICVSHFFRAAAGSSQRVMLDLGCDKRYIEMSHNKQIFACRTSPKPSRIGINVSNFNFYNLLPYEQETWILNYENKSKEYKTCDFILQTSECEIPKQIQNFIKLHDEKTECELDLPLA